LEAIDEKLTLTASSPLIGVYAPTGATLTATLTSANGTPVEGQVINFSVTPEGATLSGGKVRTNSSGQAPVVLTSNKVGTYTVTASWICPYISRHLLSLNPLQARCRRYSRGER
ncbi:Ig-like domain-containing protein, partial [Escherichia coli]